MSKRPRTRPRFELDVPYGPEEVADRVRRGLEQPAVRLCGRVYRRVVQLEVCPDDTHFWSPHLDVSLLRNDDGTTRLFGRFAPHPAIWTGFVAAQALCWMLALCAAVYGTSQWMVRQEPWALWLAGLFSLAAMLVYLTAYVGQSLGQAQMYTQRVFLDGVLGTGMAGALSGDAAEAAPPTSGTREAAGG